MDDEPSILSELLGQTRRPRNSRCAFSFGALPTFPDSESMEAAAAGEVVDNNPEKLSKG
jgi:hypothetical protein